MTIAKGKVVYSIGTPPCCGTGQSLTSDELDEAITGSVVATVFDDVGKTEVVELLLLVLAETEFKKELIEEILSRPDAIEDWRVGEGLAEVYLTDHYKCTFPWPDSRDERKSGSSLPGADLVGFQLDGSGDRFAFGEIKTSTERRYPPGTMHGRTGLKHQLEDLRDKVWTRNKLVEYLGFRAISAPWKNRYIAAFKRYAKSKTDVALFGVMIRDVEPHSDDLRVRVEKLTLDIQPEMNITLLALYLPKDSIPQLRPKVLATHAGRMS